MTERLTDQLADILGEFCPEPVEKQTYELLGSDGRDIILDDETVTVIGMPVYVGKVPLLGNVAAGRPLLSESACRRKRRGSVQTGIPAGHPH